jgi:hypothetical protein
LDDAGGGFLESPAIVWKKRLSMKESEWV